LHGFSGGKVTLYYRYFAFSGKGFTFLETGSN